MSKIEKKQIIKILNNTKVFYCKKKNIIVIKGTNGQKSLKIHNLITVNHNNKSIEIGTDVLKKFSNYKKKKVQSLKQTTVSLIKQLLIEVTAPIYIKLKLIGVGYRVFPVEGLAHYLLLLKLGYSHPIYVRIPTNTNIFCLKLTKLFIFGHSYQKITSIASKIRLNKAPEPYKGKGILYENEKVMLKEGKKV